MVKLLAVLLLALLTLSSFHSSAFATHGRGGHHKEHGHGSGSVQIDQCPTQCTRRCSKTQYHKPCMFFCQKCCRKCLCVPPGFYGNKQLCPCYNNWKTKEGGPKCP